MSWSTSRRAPSRLTPFAAGRGLEPFALRPLAGHEGADGRILPARRAGGLDEQVHALLRAEGGHAQHAEAVGVAVELGRALDALHVAGEHAVRNHLDAALRVAERLERRHLAPGHGHHVVDRARHQPGQRALVRARRQEPAGGGERRVLVVDVHGARAARDALAHELPAHAAGHDRVWTELGGRRERTPQAARVGAPAQVEALGRHTAGRDVLEEPAPARQREQLDLGPAARELGDQRGPVPLGAARAHVGTEEQEAQVRPGPAVAARPTPAAAARGAVHGQHLAGADAREVGAVGEEAGGLLLGVLARVGRADRGGLVAHGQRVHDSEPPAALARERGPVEVEAPSVAELGEREQLGGRPLSERGHRPDLDEAGLADERGRPPPRDLPGRMAAERLRRLRQVKAKRLTNRNEPVKERARKAHVVVDDERPVGKPPPSGRAERSSGPAGWPSGPGRPPRGRRIGQQPVQVLELAAAEVLGDGVLAQRRGPRGRSSRGRCARCGALSEGSATRRP